MQVVRVLLVDDNGPFLHMLTRSVRTTWQGRALGISAGPDTQSVLAPRRAPPEIDLMVAASYEQARTMRGFDGAAVDENLAGKSGLDLIASFRSRPRHRATPFLVMSGDSLDPLSHRAHELDAVPLAKLPTTQLVDCILRMVRWIGTQVHTAEEERLRRAQQLAVDANLSRALRAVLEDVARGKSYDEIAAARGSARDTVKKQAKHILEALREIDVPTFETLRSTLDAYVIEARYDP